MLKLELETVRLVANIVPPIMLILGLCGNVFSCIVYSRKKFKKFPIRYMLILLGIIDTFYLIINLTNDYFNYAFNWDARDQNETLCVVLNYFGYLIAPFSPWLLVYVSIERLVSISPSFYGLNKLKDFKYQFVYFILLIIFNLIYYLPVLQFIKLIDLKSLNKSLLYTTDLKNTTCDFIDLKDKSFFALMDLLYSTVIPGILMFLSTLLITNCIYKSSSRLFKNGGDQSRRRLRRDFKFAITSIFLNIVFITLNLPICIIYLDTVSFDLNSLKYFISLLMFYSTYAVNFYLFLLSNSTFSKEFLRLIGFSRLIKFNSDVSIDFSRRETYKITKRNNS